MDTPTNEKQEWYESEFGASFWLTLSGAMFAFLGLLLKSKCSEVKCLCFSCKKNPADVDNDLPETPKNNIV